MAAKAENTLYVKLCRVMAEAKYLQKQGRNTQQGYSYAQEADFLDLIKPLLAKEWIIVAPSYEIKEIADGETKSGTKTCRMTLELTLTFHDTESGQTLTVKTIGQGIDTGDKAPYKAMTGALKYALSKTFLVPTGDDPENDETEEQKPATKKDEPKKKETPVQQAAEQARHETNQKYLDAIQEEQSRLGSVAFGEVCKLFNVKTTGEPEYTASLLGLDSEARKKLWTMLHNTAGKS